MVGSIKGWLLCAALLTLSFSAVVHAQDDVEDLNEDQFDIVEKAFLLVRHKIDTVELVQGKNTSVVVEIYNAGNRYPLHRSRLRCSFVAGCDTVQPLHRSICLALLHDHCHRFCSAATDIVLKGAAWPLSDFEDSGGIASASWSKLSPGATVRVEYFLTPKASGPYAPLAATVTYKAETGAKTQVSLQPSARALRQGIHWSSVSYTLTAGCLWCNTCSVHPLSNSEAFENSPICGKLTLHQLECLPCHTRCGKISLQLHLGELFVSWNGTDPRAVDLGWINSRRRRCFTGWLLGIYHRNRCKQAEKIQKSTRRSDKNVVTRALHCNSIRSIADYHTALLTYQQSHSAYTLTCQHC